PLRWIDAAVAGKRLDLDPAAVRSQLLTAEVAAIRDRGGVPPADVLPAVPLDVSAHRDAESELSSALLLSDGQQADLMLCLARRHGIEPELSPPLQERLRDFVTGWIDHPDAYHPEEWALRAEVLDCAHAVLQERVGNRGAASVAGAIGRLNRYFDDRADITGVLDCHIQASLIADRRLADDRVNRLLWLLNHIADLARSPQMRHYAVDAAAGLQRALIEWDAVDGDVCVTVLTKLPDSLDIEPVIADRAAERLTQMSEKPSKALLELLASLDNRGKAPASGPLVKVLKADKYVRTFLHRALEDRLLTDTNYFEGSVAYLLEADSAVVGARADDVLAVCVQSRHPDLAPEVLVGLKAPLARLLVERWAATLGTRNLIGDGIWCVRCLSHAGLPSKLRDQLLAALRDYAAKLSEQDYDRWYRGVQRELWADGRVLWDRALTQEAPRARSRPRSSKGGSR
ncbi:MAG: hypothetical protein ACRDNF_09380, partial [Streptosporangiaceae bacterium]